MRLSIQTKFLVLCTFLVFLTTVGLSGTYYVLAKQDKQRESRQRIQIAYDMLFDNITTQNNALMAKFEEFLEQETTLRITTSSYMQDPEQLSSPSFLTSYLKEMSDALKRFGHGSIMNQVLVYGADTQLLAVYQRLEEQETIGVAMISGTEKMTYLAMDNFFALSPILFGDQPIPDTPFPEGVTMHFTGGIPETIMVFPCNHGLTAGWQIMAPIINQGQTTGILVGQLCYMQSTIQRFAALSKTEINVFVGEHFSVGTLPAQASLAPEVLSQIINCDDVFNQRADMEMLSTTLNEQAYYQGQCAYKSNQQVIWAITVSLSYDIEQQEIEKLLKAVLIISFSAFSIAAGLSWILSYKPVQSIKNIVSIIGSVAEGDLRGKATIITQDEIGMLAVKLNRMINQLRNIVGQVQRSGIQVTSSATELLVTLKQQEAIMASQTASTEKAMNSVEEISFVAADLVKTMQQVASMSQETAGFASSGQTDLKRMAEAMCQMELASKSISEKLEAINQKAENITNIVTTITKVADQTNLLSLNAAIEAEKAGEYGRGFTIIAQEIRRLADQTGVATIDIEEMIQEMQTAVLVGVEEMELFVEKVRHSTEDVANISLQLNLIIEQVQALSPNFDVVNVAIGHQSEIIQKISETMIELNEEMLQTTESLRESYIAIEQLHEASRGLRDEIVRFKVE